MCTGAEVAPLIAAAVGTGTSLYAQQDALRRQDRQAAAGIMRNAEIQNRAGARVNQEIQSVSASNPEAERKAANDDFITALQKANLSNGGPSLSGVGGASSRYAEDVGAARTAAGAESRTLAGNLARVDAPQYQRLREGQGAAATASDLGLLEREAGGNDFLTQLRVANQRVNPWVSGAGQGLSAFGTAYAGRMRPLPIDTGTASQVGRGLGTVIRGH